MNAGSTTIDRWRKFFRSAEGDIFDVLEFAIVVAASDCPNDFKTRREDIAQKLFSCGLIRSADRESVSVDGDDDGLMEFRPTGWKASVSRSSDDAIERNTSSNCSYDEAEALTMAIEESSQILDEVLRIKLILEDSDESDSALLESLRKLQLMELSMDMLQASEIGRAVSRLKKHTNNQIRSLGKLLISGWKNMVDEWVQTTNTLCGDSPDSVDPPTMVEEEGLPSPPLDEGAFMTTETTFEFSKFFEGMDDDGEPRNDGGHAKRKEHKISSNESKDEQEKRAHTHGTRGDACGERLVKTEQLIVKQTKAAARQTPKEKSGHGRPQELFGREESSVGNSQTKGRHSHIPANIKDPVTPLVKSMDEKLVTKPKMQAKLGCIQKTSATLQDKSKSSDDMLVKVKLEAAKRKLHEGYRQTENAKKQRTIQVMELHDLPKQGLLRRNPNPKPGIHSRRQWNNKRR